MSDLPIEDQPPVVIEEARIRALSRKCVALGEALEDLQRTALSTWRRPGTIMQRADYSMNVHVRVEIAAGDASKYDSTCNDRDWTRGHPTRGAAIKAALVPELRRLLKNLEDE